MRTPHRPVSHNFNRPPVLHSGSGGPVLSLDGKVVAINSAVQAGFDGSDLGAPVAFGRKIIDDIN